MTLDRRALTNYYSPWNKTIVKNGQEIYIMRIKVANSKIIFYYRTIYAHNARYVGNQLQRTQTSSYLWRAFSILKITLSSIPTSPLPAPEILHCLLSWMELVFGTRGARTPRNHWQTKGRRDQTDRRHYWTICADVQRYEPKSLQLNS